MSAAVAIPQVSDVSVQQLSLRSPAASVIPYGVAGLAMFGPLAFGAVEPWAIFVVQLSSLILICAWAIPQVRSGQIALSSNPVLAPMCAFGVLVIVQLLGTSAYRHATESGLLLYAAYGAVCFLLSQTLHRTTQIRRLATAFGVFGSCVAVFAVLQSLSSGGKLYWIRAPRFGGWIYGPYVNHNHYAGLMEMVVPIPLVFAFSRYAHGRKRWLAAAAAAFMGATIFLSGSRGGMAAFAIQATVFLWLLFRERTRNGAALLLAGFLLLALASIAWIGGSEVSARIATLGSSRHADPSTDMRLKIDADSLRMFSQWPILGCGLGTFPTVYPQFRSFYTNSFVNAAHNDYLQLLTETGIVGFAIAIWFLVAAIRPAIRKARNWPSDVNGAVAVAALLGICGILVHSFVDFNLQIPANAMLFYVLCTVAAMEPRFRNHRRDRHHHAAPEETTQA
ncbi:MAG TPA: O-antigen ligase family protein [Terriglobales bacterium]|nr:O-antigen ligase family protein [Terriglobales bacterium]